MHPILSINRFASILELPPSRLREIVENIASHYRREFLRKGDKVRELRIPNDELKDVQRRILKRVLYPIALTDHAHGGVAMRSPRSNASQHLGQKCVATCDVKSFFPSVRHRIVYRMFRHRFGFGSDVASLLTKLVTYKAELPQGAPTSTAIANLLLTHPVDGPLGQAASNRASRYTRFIDDMTFSGSSPAALINNAGRCLSGFGLQLHRKKAPVGSKSKLKVTRSNRPQEVTGLLVNSAAGPSVSKSRRDRIRAAIHQLPLIADGMVKANAISSIRGRIAHVKQFNPGSAKRMLRYLESELT